MFFGLLFVLWSSENTSGKNCTYIFLVLGCFLALLWLAGEKEVRDSAAAEEEEEEAEEAKEDDAGEDEGDGSAAAAVVEEADDVAGDPTAAVVAAVEARLNLPVCLRASWCKIINS